MYSRPMLHHLRIETVLIGASTKMLGPSLLLKMVPAAYICKAPPFIGPAECWSELEMMNSQAHCCEVDIGIMLLSIHTVAVLLL